MKTEWRKYYWYNLFLKTRMEEEKILALFTGKVRRKTRFYSL
jgi:hypothetical protein